MNLFSGRAALCGVADDVATQNYLLTPTSNAGGHVAGLAGLISSIYALDMFIFNEDRHLGNYLSIDDNGVRRFYAFDFSRSLFWRWPWVDFPASNQHTRVYGGLLRSLHGFEAAAAEGTLDRLGAVGVSTIETFINRMPANWLPAQLGHEFLTWWSGSERLKRIETLREGISNGTLL